MEKRMVPVAKKTFWRDFMGKGKWKPVLLMAGAVLGIALLLYGGSGEKKKEKDHEWDAIYADFCDNIDDKIEEFRAKTIYKCEEEKVSHHPIESTFYNRSIK